jgi:ubiquitin C-terminal hydrolase
MNYSDKYKNKGLTGLANLGNTCYINSCMQILSNCYELNELLDNSENQLNKCDDSIFLIEWKKLKDLIWSKNCIISPNRFINVIQELAIKKNRELFTGYTQNDLPEFLIFIIDCFHNSLKKEVEMSIQGKSENNLDELARKCYLMYINTYNKNYSNIISLFFGMHVSKIESEKNLSILSITPEPFCLLNLPIPQDKINCSIYDCFDLYTIKEYLSDDNAWYNEKTQQKENIYKSLNFWSLPNILIIDFKRFNNNNKKINTIIETPLTDLNLSKYIIGYDKDKYKYELVGICNHSGGCYGGHYTSFVKNANKKWYHYNDTSVTEIEEKTLISNKGYCYFYKKQNII